MYLEILGYSNREVGWITFRSLRVERLVLTKSASSAAYPSRPDPQLKASDLIEPVIASSTAHSIQHYRPKEDFADRMTQGTTRCLWIDVDGARGARYWQSLGHHDPSK